MKYYKYTLVDFATRIPVNVEPAKRGPDMPHGLTLIFSIESQSTSGVPVFYGEAQDDFEPDQWMQEVDLDFLIYTFKAELKQRASVKRKLLVSHCSTAYKDCVFNTSNLNGLQIAINALSGNNKEVDFEWCDNSWIKLDKKSVSSIVRTLNDDIQKLFSWCFEIHSSVNKASSKEELNHIQNIISEFNGNLI